MFRSVNMNVSYILDSNVSRVCRLCLAEEGVMNIFDSGGNQDLRLCEIIEELLQLEVSREDGLPEFVCQVCTSKVKDFKLFKMTCIQSKMVFLQAISKSHCAAGQNKSPLSVESADQKEGYIVENWSKEQHIEEVIENIVPPPVAVKYQHSSSAVELTSFPTMEADEPTFIGASPQVCAQVDESEVVEIKTEPLAVFTNEDSLSGDDRKGSVFKCSNSSITQISDQKLYVCDHCRNEYSDKSKLIMHMRCHTSGIPVWVNSLVNRSESKLSGEEVFGAKSDLKRCLECEICGKVFRRKGHLKSHLLIHTALKPFECGMCGRRFNQKSNLSSHLARHTSQKPFKCEVCGKAFSQKVHLTDHAVVHSGMKPFKCGTCSKGFSTVSGLKYHLVTHSDLKPFKCKVCLRDFKHKCYLRKHMMTHAIPKSYKCVMCGGEFDQKIDLTAHLSSTLHAEGELFKCKACGKEFLRRIQLRRHTTFVHSDVKPYKCDSCGKEFSQKSNLTKHSVLHSGEKPYKCQFCGKVFSLKGNLKRHTLLHDSAKVS